MAAVLQRIADTLLRLLSDRVDLLRIETREELDRLLAVGARLLLCAAACAVGLVLTALAFTDLLAPLIPSRPLRLLLVGLPLLGGGAHRALLVARSLSRTDDRDAS